MVTLQVNGLVISVPPQRSHFARSMGSLAAISPQADIAATRLFDARLSSSRIQWNYPRGPERCLLWVDTVEKGRDHRRGVIPLLGA
jgi:hypothetical protein